MVLGLAGKQRIRLSTCKDINIPVHVSHSNTILTLSLFISLELVGSKSTTEPEIDWPAVWDNSQEKRDMQSELDRIQTTGHSNPTESQAITTSYALPVTSQIQHVTKRAFTQYWRTPRYVMGKLMLATMSALFVGFSFYNQDDSQAGMQGSIFAIFMVTTVFTPLVQQVCLAFTDIPAL